jgi:glutamine synthetase
MKKCHGDDDANKEWDDKMWQQVMALRTYIAQDTMTNTSMFTQIAQAIKNEDFDRASVLQVEMMAKMEELTSLYHIYAMNIY